MSHFSDSQNRGGDDKMKKKYWVLLLILMTLNLTACGSKTYETKSSSPATDIHSGSYNSGSGKSSSSDYDYDKGYGYTAPKKGESINEYIQRQDPELYNNMKKRYKNSK